VIEPWQTGEAACSREVEEETGVVIDSTAWTYLGTFNNAYEFQGYTWPTLDVAYVARVEDLDRFEAQAVDGEASEIVFVRLPEIQLAELAFSTHSAAVQALMNSLGHLCRGFTE
jgi:NAD+ diphosphatase